MLQLQGLHCRQDSAFVKAEVVIMVSNLFASLTSSGSMSPSVNPHEGPLRFIGRPKLAAFVRRLSMLGWLRLRVARGRLRGL